MVDINNPGNYKPCSKKSFEAYVCMPFQGVYVVSSWVAAKYRLNKRYFAQDIPAALASNLASLVSSGEAQCTSQQYPFVLCDPIMQDYQVLSAMDLAQAFTFVVDGQPTPMNQALLNERLEYKQLPWTLVRASQASLFGKFAACFVPRSQQGWIVNGYTQKQEPFNVPGIPHGKGDFIVCPLINNAPNMNARYVVNGENFREMYNNKGWTDCLGGEPRRLHIDNLPNHMSQFLYEIFMHSGSWDKLTIYNAFSVNLKSWCRGGNDYDDPELWLGFDNNTGVVKWSHSNEYNRKQEGQTSISGVGQLINKLEGSYGSDKPWGAREEFSFGRR